MGFRDFGLMVYAGTKPSRGDAPLPMIAYLDLQDDIPYREGSELVDRLEAAVENDKQAIDMSHPRMFWKDDAGQGKPSGAAYRPTNRGFWQTGTTPLKSQLKP